MDELKKVSDFILNNFLENKKTFILISKVYPYFFLQFLEKNLEKKKIKLVIFKNDQFNFFRDQTLFLESFYQKVFFYNFLENNEEEKKIDYESSAVILTEEDFLKKNKNNEILKLDLNTFLNIDSINYINKFLNKREKYYSEILFKKFKKLKIEKYFNLLSYSAFLKESSWEELLIYFEKEIEREKYSLFDISTFFFKKDKVEFYKLWNLIKNDYEIEFWNFYWLKQIWQAYKFLFLDFNENIKYNLPFWFIKNGKKIFKKIDFLNILKGFYIEINFLKEKNFDINHEVNPCEKIFFYWFF